MERSEDPTGRYHLIQKSGPDQYIQYTAISKDTGRIYEARSVHRKSVLSCHFFEKLRNEFEILGSISHPLIQKFIEGSFESQSYFQIVESEAVNLLQFYERDFPLTERVARQIMFYLVKAVAYLHQNDIVHLNIRPDKVFIVGGKFRLGGFFCAKFASEDEIVIGSYGTPNFQAPEIFGNPNFDGRRADVWACGIFLLAILIGRLPFEFVGQMSSDGGEALEAIRKQVTENEIDIPEYLSDEVRDLLKQMLARDPAKRPSMNAVKDHRWLSEVVDQNGVLPPASTRMATKSLLRTTKTAEQVFQIIEQFFKGEEVHKSSASGMQVFKRMPQTVIRFDVSDIDGSTRNVVIKKLRADDEHLYDRILLSLLSVLG